MIAQKVGSGNQRLASLLFNEKMDTTSQGPINEIRCRSSGRLGGTIGFETPSSIRIPPEIRPLRPIESQEGVDFMRAAVGEYMGHVESGVISGHNIERLSIKTVVQDDVYDSLADAFRGTGAVLEGRLNIGDGYSLVYIGYNRASRKLVETSQIHVEREIRALHTAGTDSTEASNIANILSSNGHIRYELFDNKTRRIPDSDYHGIAGLLRKFEYSYDSSIRNITSTQNTVVLAYDSSRNVVGIAVTEHNPIMLSNGTVLYTAELTDFAVSGEHNGRKISYTMADILLENIFSGNMGSGHHAIFAEANAGNHIITTFSMLGGQTTGILPNHINIISPSGRSDLQSFALMQFTEDSVDNSAFRSVART
ncbi:MAG: hypothetical protein KGH64_01075 [Candidatus Micrarchaeota archaeon]|nr:hypothetical protein [Candidatus Micrarchaeota archaeon]MDE1833909.1 hypothetical protein [Candidatus Micrarchaeota archaeon]MDE1859889.1 hypothetical protein [Candidatus Micrarchaeota archaeon]